MSDPELNTIEHLHQVASENDEMNQPKEEVIVQTTKLNELNNECLNYIFNHLEFIDMLNIADTCTLFKHIVNSIFDSKYKETNVNVKLMQHKRSEIGGVDECPDDIRYLKTFLQLVRQFGHQIKVLKFEPINLYLEDSGEELFALNFKHAISYINQYLANSLFEIHILYCPKGMLKHLIPLPNVEIVKMQSFAFIDLEKDLLNRLFPKLRQLFYVDYNKSLGIIDNLIPNLEHLEVRRGDMNAWKNMSLKALQLNPQLRSLCIDIGPDIEVLQTIENLQHLEKLSFFWDTKYAVNFNDKILYNRNVKEFKVDYYRDHISSVPRIPFIFESLEKCSISVNTVLIDEIYKFLNGHPTIVELKLNVNSGKLDLKNIATALPSLQDVYIESNEKFAEEKIIEFVTKIQLLNRFCCSQFNEDEYERLKKLLGKFGWTSAINKATITLERSI